MMLQVLNCVGGGGCHCACRYVFPCPPLDVLSCGWKLYYKVFNRGFKINRVKSQHLPPPLTIKASFISYPCGQANMSTYQYLVLQPKKSQKRQKHNFNVALYHVLG